ncbi:hypothetical protein D3C72_749830 [compost metagenome]
MVRDRVVSNRRRHRRALAADPKTRGDYDGRLLQASRRHKLVQSGHLWGRWTVPLASLSSHLCRKLRHFTEEHIAEGCRDHAKGGHRGVDPQPPSG